MATGETRRQLAMRKLEAFIWLLGFLVLFAGYLYGGQRVGANSDDASIILEGQAMLHGNLLLHGWYLPSDNFLTTDMPLDALGSVFFTAQQLLKITPALLYAATVLGATYLASRRVSDPASRWLSAAACLALTAFPVGLLFTIVMQSPMHIGTIVASLLAWLAYDHFVKRPASYGPLGLFVLVTTLAIIGDPMAELLIVMPVGIVSSAMLWRTRGRESTALATLGAALLALLLGIGLRQALVTSGTFINPANLRLASLYHIWVHTQYLLVGIYLLFHINLQPSVGLKLFNIYTVPSIGFDQQVAFLVLNAGFLVVCTVGFIKLFRHSLIPTDMQHSLTNVLSWAIVSSIAAFLFTTFAVDIIGIRYLFPALVYAGILCYSALARIIARAHLARVILAFLAVSGLTFGVLLAEAPGATVPQKPLITFLKSHHLTYGLGTYWAANITTLESDGQVRILPVLLQDGHVLDFRWHAEASWFNNQQLGAVRFVVVDGSVPMAPFQEALIKTFGPPDHTYHLGKYPNYSYVIFAWDHSIVSSAVELSPPVDSAAGETGVAIMRTSEPYRPIGWSCRPSLHPALAPL
ncbi:MAG: hypothetical protein ACLQUY_26500 [Ktedonobacterales bacterium]